MKTSRKTAARREAEAAEKLLAPFRHFHPETEVDAIINARVFNLDAARALEAKCNEAARAGHASALDEGRRLGDFIRIRLS